MNAALYIRVSTEDQMELSPDSQKKLLLEYAKKNDLLVEDEHIFMDEGISGRKAEKRPQFMNMIALAKKKKKPFEKILVWKFSRFARNQEESIVYKNMLRKDGVEVISISEPIIDGPFGSLIERIIEWMDEYYSIRLSSEVTRGMTEKARRGGVQSSPAYGYDIIDNKYFINKNEAENIEIIFNKFLNLNSCREIASFLNSIGKKNRKGNMFEGRNIKYILQNPVYCGMIRWNYASQKDGSRKIKDSSEWIIAEGVHEPIVSKEVFDEVQKILGKQANVFSGRKPNSSEYKHWLGGLLRCASCGTTLTYTAYGKSSLSKNSKYLGYFLCNKYKKKSCDVKNSITIKQAEELLILKLEEDLVDLASENYKKITIEEKNEDELITLNKQLEKIKKKLEKAKAAYLAEIDTLEEYKDSKKNIQAEEQAILLKIEHYKTKDINTEKISNDIITAIQLIKNENIDIKTINNHLKTFISEITIDRGNGTFDIHYINPL